MALTASSTLSRLLSSTTTTKTLTLTLTMKATTTATSFPHSLLSNPLPSLKLVPTILPKLHPIRLSSSTTTTTTTTTAATISVGQPLPDSTLSYLDPTDTLQTVTISDLTKGKTVILFAVPGAFTPTCSQKHLPGYVAKAEELKAKGVDVIACVSVNDAFVMKAWKDQLGVQDEVMLLSDGNGDFTRAIGAELDLRDKPVGLGVRSRRYAMLVKDGVVKALNMEEGGAFTNSSAEDMLKLL